ncbi:MAG: hypothetical protein SFU86_03010 [Pirellulaceae bacterium]|nr:hypothetical protein [Pirellulaceae bacterium]
MSTTIALDAARVEPISAPPSEETAAAPVAISETSAPGAAVEQAAEPVVEQVAPQAAPTRGVLLAERIRRSSVLPPGLRSRLAELALADESAAAVDSAVRAVEETLPLLLRADRAGTKRAAHPTGEAFFTGDDGELSDDEAEQIAWQQLQRSGLLRGQRVRVGD